MQYICFNSGETTEIHCNQLSPQCMREVGKWVDQATAQMETVVPIPRSNYAGMMSLLPAVGDPSQKVGALMTFGRADGSNMVLHYSMCWTTDKAESRAMYQASFDSCELYRVNAVPIKKPVVAPWAAFVYTIGALVSSHAEMSFVGQFGGAVAMILAQRHFKVGPEVHHKNN